MSSKTDVRKVDRKVYVYTCNRCGIEALEEALVGWMMCCLFEADTLRGGYVSADPGKAQHTCPACTAVLVAAMNVKPLQTPGERYLADKAAS